MIPALANQNGPFTIGPGTSATKLLRQATHSTELFQVFGFGPMSTSIFSPQRGHSICTLRAETFLSGAGPVPGIGTHNGRDCGISSPNVNRYEIEQTALLSGAVQPGTSPISPNSAVWYTKLTSRAAISKGRESPKHGAAYSKLDRRHFVLLNRPFSLQLSVNDTAGLTC